MRFVLSSLEDIKKVAPEFIAALGDRKMVAFYGEMGAGKTTFINGLLALMSIEDHVSSPTFSIVNEYFSRVYGKVYHFDFYRIEDEVEALDIGVEEIFDENAYCFIEWPEKIDNLIPENCVSVHIELDNAVRIIHLEL
ncbi:MAG: tRNA (adenosine(37)-N6)-threonylcarbamoyltransferase complex ATPase subunit type 1 TsaE [Crocinitomix sp.]|nr:tRNA (adenosine(37)-N6)-threonylcarbamoyltransferase complex ATPase subunit type 1 TsaE [Crocinitomix sp.]